MCSPDAYGIVISSAPMTITSLESDILSIEDIGLVANESAILDIALEEALPSSDIKADVSDVPQTDVVVTSSSETLIDLAAHSGSMGLVEHLT